MPALGVAGSAWAHRPCPRLYGGIPVRRDPPSTAVRRRRRHPQRPSAPVRTDAHAATRRARLPAASQVTLEVGRLRHRDARWPARLDPVSSAPTRSRSTSPALAFMVPLGLRIVGRRGARGPRRGRRRSGARRARRDGRPSAAAPRSWRRSASTLFLCPVPCCASSPSTRASDRHRGAPPGHRRRVPAVRRHAGRGHRRAARHRRHADADDRERRRPLGARPAGRLRAVLLGRVGRGAASGSASHRPRLRRPSSSAWSGAGVGAIDTSRARPGSRLLRAAAIMIDDATATSSRTFFDALARQRGRRRHG